METEIRELYGSTTTEADLMDINGDGLPDRVEKKSAGSLYVRLNTGNGFDEADDWVLPDSDKLIRSSAGGTTTHDLIDMNGDGQADRVKKDDEGDTLSVWLSRTLSTPFDTPGFEQYPQGWTGDSTTSHIRTVEQNETSITTTSDLIDMNGDGLPDRVDSSGSGLTVRLNTGSAFAPAASWNLPFPDKHLRYVETYTDDSTATLYDLMDINGDGLPDRVVKSGDGALSVYFNTGSGFDPSAQNWGGDSATARIRNSSKTDDNRLTEADLMDVNGDGLPDRVSKGAGEFDLDVRLNTGSGFAPAEIWTLPDQPYVRFKNVTDTQYDLMDFNGDGVLDRVIKQYDWENAVSVYPGKTSASSDILISKITNPLGGSSEYTYKAIPKGQGVFEDTNPFYKPKRLVVESVTIDNGLGYQERVVYDYVDGQYNAVTREDYGFGKIVSTEEATDTQRERHYYQDEDRGGRLKKEITRGPGSGATRPIFSYTFYEYTNLAELSSDYGYNISQSRPVGGPDVNVKSVKLTAVDRYLVDGSTWLDDEGFNRPGGSDWKQARTTFAYTEYGLVAQKTSYAEYTGGDNSSKVEIDTSYSSDTSTWQFLPDVVTTSEYSASGGFSPSGVTSYTYTSQGLVDTITTSKDAGHSVTTQMSYDTCGNVTNVTDPNGNMTTSTYDTRYCAFPETETAPAVTGITFVATTEYDPLMRPHIVRDANGKETITDYDAFGRVTGITTPGDNSSTISYGYGQDGQAPESITVTIKDGPQSLSYVDGFGNTIQTKVKGVDENNAVQWRTVDTWHEVENTKRRVTRSETYLSASSDFNHDNERPATSQESQQHLMSTTTWLDAGEGRVSETINFAGDLSRVVVEHFTTTRTDEEGRSTTTILDPANRKKTVREANAAETVYETFFDEERITDAEQRVTVRTFNLAGELLTLDDPDLGTRSYSYDDNGNLLSATDNAQQTIFYTYDAHNRLTLVDYPAGTDTGYYYDGDDNGDGSIDGERDGLKGLQSRVTDASGSTTWWYDARYNISKEEKTIGENTAATEFSYNSYQLTGVTYPDGSQASYSFNAVADAIQLSGAGQNIVSEVRYNPLGKMTRMAHGNGLETLYDYYDATGSFRLENLTVKEIDGPAEFIDRTYSYDRVGNILGIDDTNNQYDQTFTYDELYRLKTHASGFLAESESFLYSLTGNLESKNGHSYSYNDSTHQVSSVSHDDQTTTYTYDSNGNLQGRFDNDGNQLAAYTYDADNRLSTVSSGGYYEYDYSGRRVKKTEAGRATYYFNEYYEEETREPTFYLLWTCSGDCSASSLPDGTSARPLGGAGVGSASDESATPVVSKYYYLNGLRVAKAVDGVLTWIHSDHLSSATVLTDADGHELRRLAYAAFGEEAENSGPGAAPTYSYTGKELDGSGFYYYGARYYDPALSRFITPDPLYDRGPQGLNRYSYALNNPILYRDPTGHFISGPEDDENPKGYGTVTGSSEQMTDGTAWVHNPGKKSRPLNRLSQYFFRKTTRDDKWTGVFKMGIEADCGPACEKLRKGMRKALHLQPDDIHCNYQSECTASLIDPQVALTAAHCTLREKDDVAYYLSSREGGKFIYGRLVQEPRYRGGEHDIALLLFDGAVSDYDIYSLDTQEAKMGEKGVTLGYGPGSTHNPAIMSVTVVGFRGNHVNVDVDTSIMGGDSGGPTFIMRNGQRYIMAVTNSVGNEGNYVLPVSRYSDWIDETVVKHTGHHLGEY